MHLLVEILIGIAFLLAIAAGVAIGLGILWFFVGIPDRINAAREDRERKRRAAAAGV